MTDNALSLPSRGLHSRLDAASKTADVYLYTPIGEYWGGITAERFQQELNAIGKPSEIRLYINSDGGEVFQGISIYNMLVRHTAKINVFVDGIAASIASLIAMSGSTITMGPNTFMMIHEPWGGGHGTAADLRKQADTLDKVRVQLVDTYARKTGLSADKISDLISAESWFDATEALKLGFATAISPAATAMSAMRYDLSRFRNAPAGAKRPLQPTPAAIRLRAKYGRTFSVITNEAGQPFAVEPLVPSASALTA
jgi:ATP-dependent Clp endopeptidase proteolytic subunit ClpP